MALYYWHWMRKMITHYLHIQENNIAITLSKIDDTVEYKYIIGLYETKSGPAVRIVRNKKK